MANSSPDTLVMQLNINGCSKHSISALNNYINTNEAKIVFLSETKTSDLTDNDFQNYRVILKPNLENPTQKGRVAILIHNSIMADRLHDLETHNSDTIFILATILGERILLCGSYVPPNNLTALKRLQSLVQSSIDQLNRVKCKYFAAFGDFNTRHPHWNDSKTNKQGEELFEFCNSHNLHIPKFHNDYTFLCDLGGSIIDIAITNMNAHKLFRNQYVDNIEELFTGAPSRGHIPVWSQLSLRHTKTQSKTINCWSRTNWDNYTNHLEELSIMTTPDIQSLDPSSIWLKILNNLGRCRELFVPKITLSPHSKPYWTKELSVLSAKLRLARKKFKYRSTFDNGNDLQQLKSEFREALDKAKNNFIEQKAEGLNRSEGHDFWRNFKRTFYTTQDTLIGTLQLNDKILTEDEDKAEAFFQEIFEGKHLTHCEFSDEWYQKVNREYNHESQGVSQFPQMMSPITTNELLDAISKIKISGKGADSDGVHPYMLKFGGSQFHINLLILFNKILSTGDWPFTDNNRVIFLKKLGKKNYNDPANFRPITLGSICGKLLERIIESRLRTITENHKWLGPNQHGFRKNKSTSTYLAQLIANVQHNCSIKFPTAGLFVDLQKAFDSIWHNGLLYRLAELGFRGKFLKLIENFLKHRKLRICVNNYISPAKLCNIGLPQGSVLSPLLFLIYIRDMLANADGLSLQYADDCSVICSKPDQTSLHQTLGSTCQIITDWLKKWRLKVNCGKTDSIFFNSFPTNLLISNEAINIVSETKVLGLFVDKNLSFSKQRDISKATISRKWNLLVPYIHNGLLPRATKTILSTVILPKVCYNLFLWDKSDFSIHKYMKDLSGCIFTPSTLTLHKLTNIKPFEIRKKAEIFSLCRLAAADSTLNYILSLNKSKLQKQILCCLAKLLGRRFDHKSIKIDHFSRYTIKKVLAKEEKSLWKTHTQYDYNSTGLLGSLERDFLDKHPIPLHVSRKLVGLLCGLLTGQIQLQAHLYNLRLTFTPTCSCLMEDETVHHYIFSCPNYEHLRQNVNPDPHDYSSMLDFIKESERFI